MTTLSRNCSQGRQGHFNATHTGLFQQLQHWFKIQELKLEVKRERQQLSGMSNSMLNDMGISRAEADAEAARQDLPIERLKQLQQNTG